IFLRPGRVMKVMASLATELAALLKRRTGSITEQNKHYPRQLIHLDLSANDSGTI
ncbi:hypothetical protein COCMIDRAFT_108393, partial [Bipolaris oryzae ATCC 44560]